MEKWIHIHLYANNLSQKCLPHHTYICTQTHKNTILETYTNIIYIIQIYMYRKYIYIYIYILVYIYIYIYIYTQIDNAYMQTHTQTHTYTGKQKHKHKHNEKHKVIDTPKYIYTLILSKKHTNSHTRRIH